ncbi:methyl-accepting chemotaxis protein [Curvibacter sp. APW13]|uniref:methyl-accepting chemotaxis protein n=1 Tax=Curvibacter sp. APW13 TaxID=3077236 RepID=UPI0028DE6281|nr:methyl-accepting chemotaxis protein [Curvibacter sp. APW13]MDT8990477.1 methyl-accepting chemotaxis protein [Curvibacter sp. APW13]
MQVNLPVTQREVDYPDATMLVSVTDTRGYITHCNSAFVDVSGYSAEELRGSNHNLIRHPDMPPAAFRDLWRTVGRGKLWSGVVKNRCKNGDHYWVQAHVSPIMERGKPVAYMSVRTKPSRATVAATEQLYAQMRNTEERDWPFTLQAGELRPKGLRGLLRRLTDLSPTWHLAGGLIALLGLAVLPAWATPLTGTALLATQAALLAVGGAALLWWFERSIRLPVDRAQELADVLASCNLSQHEVQGVSGPIAPLFRSLAQIQINLRAVVADVRRESSVFTQGASEIAAGGLDLSARTEAQANSLQQTAASMEQLSGSVAQTATTAQGLGESSARSMETVKQGGSAVEKVGVAMQSINTASSQVHDIIGVIEGIAFQTNILALNAAVEAARAGEHGRGFAVVAQEVRALAQRSAAASREIRDVLARSGEAIEVGMREMNTARAVVEEVVSSVQGMGPAIAQISEAMQQQSNGIAQVNSAVAQLDTVTQQNAALVEQSAASSAGLNESAVRLVNAVDVFRL